MAARSHPRPTPRLANVVTAPTYWCVIPSPYRSVDIPASRVSFRLARPAGFQHAAVASFATATNAPPIARARAPTPFLNALNAPMPSAIATADRTRMSARLTIIALFIVACTPFSRVAEFGSPDPQARQPVFASLPVDEQRSLTIER